MSHEPPAYSNAIPGPAPTVNVHESLPSQRRSPAPDPRPRHPPLPLRLGGIAWIVAGILFAAAPLLAAHLTRLQADVLLTKIESLTAAGLAPNVPELAQLNEILSEVTRFSGEIWGAIDWILTPLIIGYGFFALLSLALYIVLSIFTMRGAQWARIFATVLCGISIPAAVSVWLTVASLSWLPLNALWANHIGLALIVLEVLGLVLVWLPQSNTFVRNLHRVRGST